jgi:hypothetical protein
MSKKLYISLAFALALLVSVYAFFSRNPKNIEPDESGHDVQVEELKQDEKAIEEVDSEPIESKHKSDDIEKTERELEEEQTKATGETGISSELKSAELASDEEEIIEASDEAKEQLEENKRDEKKDLSAQEVSSAKLISDQKIFRRFLNGRFNGSAKVKRNKKTEIWEITMYTKYEKEGGELSGESSIEVSGGEYSGRHRSEGTNRGFLQLEDGSILIEISPQAYLKVNRKNRERLRGQIFEKEKKSGAYLSLGKFELSREL